MRGRRVPVPLELLEVGGGGGEERVGERRGAARGRGARVQRRRGERVRAAAAARARRAARAEPAPRAAAAHHRPWGGHLYMHKGDRLRHPDIDARPRPINLRSFYMYVLYETYHRERNFGHATPKSVKQEMEISTSAVEAATKS